MNLRELKGKPIVEVRSARKLGIVGDVFLGPTHQSMAALLVQPISRGTEYVVFMDHVCSIGPDTVAIDRVDSLRVLDQTPELTHLTSADSLLGSGIVTEGGRILGIIDGVECDPTSHQVTGITYVSTPLAGTAGTHQILDPRDLIATVPDVVTVREAAQRPEAA